MFSRMRVVVLAIAVFAIAIAPIGCTATKADPAVVEGDWTLESFGGTTELKPADPTVTSTLTLNDGEAGGNGGVNSFSGPYEVKDDNGLEFGALAATEMAGPQAAMDQEAAFFKALGDTRHFEINEGKLILSDTGNDTLLILAPK